MEMEVEVIETTGEKEMSVQPEVRE